MSDIKPGQTTTEFYLAIMTAAIGLVMIVFGALLSAGVLDGNENATTVGGNLMLYGVGLLGTTSAGYGISRGIAKTAVKPQAPAVGGVFDN